MRLAQLLETFDVPVYQKPEKEMRVVGDLLFDSVCIVWYQSRIGLVVKEPLSEWAGRVVDEVLHELVHLLAGPKSFRDEGPSMVLQWALMKKLDPEDAMWARKEFGRYSIGEGAFVDEVGPNDKFVRRRAWRRLVQEAKDAKLVHRGRPVRDAVPLQAWRAFVRRSRNLEAVPVRFYPS